MDSSSHGPSVSELRKIFMPTSRNRDVRPRLKRAIDRQESKLASELSGRNRNASFGPTCERHDIPAVGLVNEIKTRLKEQMHPRARFDGQFVEKKTIYKINDSYFVRKTCTSSTEESNLERIKYRQDGGQTQANGHFHFNETSSNTASIDSGFAPDHSSVKESGSEISNQEFGTKYSEGLEGSIGVEFGVSLGGRDCFSLEQINNEPRDQYSSFISVIDLKSSDPEDGAIESHKVDTNRGHYRRKVPSNRQRVESMKRYSVHQMQRSRPNRRSSVTRIEVGSESPDSVYFSEPEYDDDDDCNSLWTNSKSDLSAIWSHSMGPPTNEFPQTMDKCGVIGDRRERRKSRGEKRHTCEVDFSGGWSQEGHTVMNSGNFGGSFNNLDMRTQFCPLRKSLSETSFNVDLTDVGKVKDDYKVSMLMSPSEDGPLDFPRFPPKTLLHRDIAIQSNDLRSLEQKHESTNEQDEQNEQDCSKQVEDLKINQNEAKSQRKESVIKKILNKSFTMARRGFRHKWTQKRSSLEQEVLHKRLIKPSDETSSSGYQPLDNLSSNKTGMIRTLKTFLPHQSNLCSPHETSVDTRLDDVDWMEEFEGNKQFAMYPMWDFENKLKKTSNTNYRINDCVKAVDVLSMLKDPHKDSVTESVELLQNEDQSKSRVPIVSLKGGQLNVAMTEDIRNGTVHKIRRTISVDLRTSDSTRGLLSELKESLSYQDGGDNDDEIIISEIDVSVEKNVELLARLIVLSEMNKLARVEKT